MLRGLWEYHELRGDLKTALELAEELPRLALAADDAALRLVAHDVLGDTLYWLGEFPRALGHLEQGIALYRFASTVLSPINTLGMIRASHAGASRRIRSGTWAILTARSR